MSQLWKNYTLTSDQSSLTIPILQPLMAQIGVSNAMSVALLIQLVKARITRSSIMFVDDGAVNAEAPSKKGGVRSNEILDEQKQIPRT